MPPSPLLSAGAKRADKNWSSCCFLSELRLGVPQILVVAVQHGWEELNRQQLSSGRAWEVNVKLPGGGVRLPAACGRPDCRGPVA
jgi:hypothetical protein